MKPPRTSRERYRRFLQDYRQRRLDDLTAPGEELPAPDAGGRRRSRRPEN